MASTPKMKSASFQKNTRIPTWMEMEIDSIHRIYFDLPLSERYWPKIIRVFLKDLIETAIKNLGKETFSSTADLDKVTKQLNEPTSVYITVKHRNIVKEAIEIIRLRSPHCGFIIKPPSNRFSLSVADCVWPNDVLEKEDLYSSLCKMTLRIDIENFVWNFLGKLFDNQTVFKIYCTANMLDETSKPYDYPIVVEIQGEDKCRQLQSYIHNLSKNLPTYEGLLPEDVIQVKFREEMLEVFVKEEEFHTNGSQWKQGTLGGILEYNGDVYGVTSGHVDKLNHPQFDKLKLSDSSEPVCVHDVDVSFVKLLNVDIEMKNQIFNLLPLQFMENFDQKLQCGEEIYKIGFSTGFTTGKLVGSKVSFRCPTDGQIFRNHVEVKWLNNETRFAFNGDCGALYCVKRGIMFAPIAIHRISNSNSNGSTSYGCDFASAMEYFPIRSDLDLSPSFVNAEHLII
jgi:hypothetical protein